MREPAAILRDDLDKTGFVVIRSYIFGDRLAAQFGLSTIGMPEYVGYAIGYQVVQASKAVEQATFLPTDEILAASGYFE